MKRKLIAVFLSFLEACLAAVLLLSAFPMYDQAWVAWVGLVPLFLAISGKSLKHSFLLSFICGILFFSGLYTWIFEAPGYKILHHVILALILAPYFGLFGLLYSFVFKRWGPGYALAAAPFIWVSLEFARSNLGFLALPFPILAHSQYDHLGMIQFASFSGAYGVSFLIVWANSAVAAVILSLLPKSARPSSNGPSRSGALGLALLSVVFVALAWIHGQHALSEPMGDKSIRVSVVQGNIDRKKKADPKKYAPYIMETYADLTQRVSGDHADLIVWPEAATPGFILKNFVLYKEMVAIVKKARTHFLVGSAEFPKFMKEASVEEGKYGNTALFFSPEGKVLKQYLKIKLIPFAEYIPYEGVIPWPHFIVPGNIGSYEVPGSQYTLFELRGATFGAVICSECAFPEVFRIFVKRGANFMVNMTNEGWFGDTALHQKVAASVFRCVENRISLARATNTGISCFIDPYGRITGRVERDNKNISIEGCLTRDMVLTEERTFYTNYGDVFAYSSLVITVFTLAAAFVKNRNLR